MREIVDELMHDIRGAREFDLVSGLSIPLPMIVIAEMLGVEPERRHDFKRWSDGLVSGISGSGRTQGFAESGFAETMREFTEYLQDIAAKRKAEPRDDLITALVRAEEGEGTLSAFQVVMFATVLMVAGNETTTNLIGNTVNTLLDHPEQLDLVVRDPSLIPALVDESLRYQSPIQFLFRRATEDLEIAGVQIPKDSLVVPLLASANRDERQFENGDVFDITRNAQGHVAFGLGVHYCLGSHLWHGSRAGSLSRPSCPSCPGCGATIRRWNTWIHSWSAGRRGSSCRGQLEIHALPGGTSRDPRVRCLGISRVPVITGWALAIASQQHVGGADAAVAAGGACEGHHQGRQRRRSQPLDQRLLEDGLAGGVAAASVHDQHAAASFAVHPSHHFADPPLRRALDHAVQVDAFVGPHLSVAQPQQLRAIDARGDPLDVLAQPLGLEGDALAGLPRLAPAQRPGRRAQLVPTLERADIRHGFSEDSLLGVAVVLPAAHRQYPRFEVVGVKSSRRCGFSHR